MCIRDSGISELVAFHGWVPHHKALSLLSNARIFVLPSIREGLPLALIEAMALRRAVIATSVGGIPEIIKNGQNGLLVKPGEPRELASAIIKLITNEELFKQICKEAGKSIEMFSWAKVCKLYEHLYRLLAK